MLRRGRAFLSLVLVLAVFAGAAPLAALDVPFLAGRVNDQANLMTTEVRQRIDQKLAAFEQKTGAQVVVLTLPSLEGESVEDFSHKVATAWKLGQKDKDNGVLFLIARDDRKMRIEVGYGLEPELTDLESGRILSDVVAPYFRNGDYGGGIEHGVDSILGSLEGQEVAPAPLAGQDEMPFGSRLLVGLFMLGVLGVFSMTALASKGCQSWFLYLFLVPFYAIFPSIVMPALGIWAAGIWLVLFPILKLLFPKLGSKLPSSMGRWGGGPFIGGGWGGGGGGGGWSGGGGGGFSGGGGSFGGGGSSGSW